jgi:two-component system alkaline phosphatase synthesis response regulator PhoP
MDKINKKVLVVEDDVTMREIVVHKLGSAGLTVVEAGDGKEAIDVWTKERPDIVLLDLMLPELDGFKVLETMRKHHESVVANTPVIVLSNLFSKEDMQRTKQLTVDDFLVKAYHTTEEILDRVKEVLDRQNPPPAVSK